MNLACPSVVQPLSTCNWQMLHDSGPTVKMGILQTNVATRSSILILIRARPMQYADMQATRNAPESPKDTSEPVQRGDIISLSFIPLTKVDTANLFNSVYY
jgi:hypothetical protein